MNLVEFYIEMYRKSVENISTGNYIMDEYLGGKTDKRFGLSLIVRPSKEVLEKIASFLNELKRSAPNQYYYPLSDIHVTIMSIISPQTGIDFEKLNMHDYNTLIKESLIFDKQIKINFKGVTASNSCIMLQGFVSDDSITQIRNNLRGIFKNSDLLHDIDKRYKIHTAHATVVRFQNEFIDLNGFLSTIERFKDVDFGSFELKYIEFTYSDWYHSVPNEEILFDYKIKKTGLI